MRDYNKLNDALAGTLDSLVDRWLPDGKLNGAEYTAINPTRSDNKLGSFKINVRNGKWSDFADGASGVGAISLYAYLNGIKNSEAYDALSDNTEIVSYAQRAYKKRETVEEWEILPLPAIEPSGEHFELGFPIAKYRYEDFYVFRYLKPDGSKDIRPYTYRRHRESGIIEWKWKGKEKNRAIYGKERISYEQPILIVEGEKAANVKVEGYIVVSWAGGSNAIDKTDWTPLANRKDVLFWPDRDEAGHKTVEKLKEKLPLIGVIPVDFSIGDGQDIADITHDEIQRKLKFYIKSDAKKEEVVKETIKIPFKGKYIPHLEIERGVIISITGSGKTFQYLDQPETLILVPRVLQSDVRSGDAGDYVLSKIFTEGAIMTYDKFYGHYRNNQEFRDNVNNKRFKIICDEAHVLTAIPSKAHQLAYGLDAIFISGTLDASFRTDLQHYKFIPEHRPIIYYTNGTLPKIKGTLVFADNARAIIANYNNCGFVSYDNKDNNNIDFQTTQEPLVVSTSAAREGYSINNDNFKANMVYMQYCSLWSSKDIIQGLNRVRGEDILRIVSLPFKEQYTKHISFEWWKKFIENCTNDKEVNAIMGEFYSKMIKITHKMEAYERANDYGIACYLAYLTRNNIDEELYDIREYTFECEPLTLNMDADKKELDEEYLEYTLHDGSRWKVPKAKETDFKKFAAVYDTNIIKKMMKLDGVRNFGEVYDFSKVARKIREDYNRSNKKNGKKYSIAEWYKLLKTLVKIRLINEDFEKIERPQSVKSLRNVYFEIVGICGIDGVEEISE